MAGPTPKVLLIEDEASQRALLSYNLQAEGFAVVEAGDGEEGLLLVEEEAPDLILLDWMLPGLSGIEVCRRLKTRTETRGGARNILPARAGGGGRG
ncbi:MAG TPA: DNA-binding response regulator, partial [Rhodobacteraceae bacterium]|nr:DNA-binding response regulator [Paracoccaceae bacterium]